MQIRELSTKVTSTQLNESLAKKFGYKLSIDKFTDVQLEQVRNHLVGKVTNFEKTNSFDSVLENNDYQKDRAMLDVVRQAIKERTLSDSEKEKKEKYVKGMKKASGTFKKKYGDKGEEEKAALIMSSRDMVDRVTGWLEDVSSMKAESMLELVDSIRDELGNDIAQQFNDAVKPALEELYTSLETHRTTLAQAVSILTGEEGPGGAPAAPAMGAEMPSTMAAPEEGGDEFAASEPATGGEEAAGRAKRESIEYSRKLGTILSSKKK